MAVDNLLCGHDHSRSAESALEAVLVPERFLHGIELAIVCQAFHGYDLRAVGLHGKHRATFDGFAVQLHGARSAERSFAAHVRAREACDVAQEMDEQQAWFDILGIAFSIDGEIDVHDLLRWGPIQRCRRYQNFGQGASIIRLNKAAGLR